MQYKINCIRCKYYYVTWQPQTPHGCKAFGFTSKVIPSTVVKKSSGKNCEVFQPKSKNQP